MKPTIKVSIGGFAFNLEENAYQIIDNYLKTLAKYFVNKPEGEEIISDVESRMAELLQMRMTHPESVISETDASDIISIMGNPKDFAGGEVEEPVIEKKERFDFRKKLYRDPDHGIIGGVCSGLGYYFRIDPVAIRVIFVLALLLLNFQSHHISGNGFVLLVYVVLWIVMPKATTFTQKLTMMGTDPSIENIENRDRVEQLNRPRTSSSLLKAIRVIFSVILGMICLTILIAIVAIVAAFFGFYFKLGIPMINICMDAFDLYSLDQKIAMIMAICLPLIGLFYLCIKLLFQLRFTVRDLVISSIAFILWIGAAFYVTGVVLNIVQEHRFNHTVVEDIPVSTNSDVLYIKLNDNIIDSEPWANYSFLSYVEHSKNNYSLFLLPEIRIRYDSLQTDFRIELKKTAFDGTRSGARKRANNINLDYVIHDSVIVLNPQIYNRNYLWDRKLFKINIIAPVNKSVVLDEPLIYNKRIYSDFY